MTADGFAPGYRSRITRGRRAARISLAVLLMLGAGCKRTEEPSTAAESIRPPPVESSISPQQVATLFAQLGDGGAASAEAALPDPQEFSPTDPNWPVLSYLLGETHLQRGNVDRARIAFRDLASWGAADLTEASHDGWGGSGLAAVALWRWLQILDEHGGDPEDFDRALDVAAALRTTRLFGGMVGSGLLPALPLLEEDVARRLTHIASKAGRPEAKSLILYFVSINSTGVLDPIDHAIIDTMIADKQVTRDRLDLFRSQRLLNRVTVQVRKKEALEQLERLWRNPSAPTDVRAEASYEWANSYRRSKSRKAEVVAALTAAYELSGGKGPVAEKALFRRAMVQGSVDPRRADLFTAGLEQLLARHAKSRLADDALYQIATEQLFSQNPRLDHAFDTFAKLRAFSGPNDWLDSAYFLPAMGYVDRGTPTDLQAADRLLAEYLDRYPDGVFRQRCLFWRGRIAELNRDLRTAKRLFQQVIDETPYDYYGLRSRLHRELGAAATQVPLPRPDSLTFAELQDAYRHSHVDAELTGHTRYHDRLRMAAASGLYVRVRAIVDSLGARFRNRVDNIPLQQLEGDHLIPAVALLLSLRQDVLAARDAQPTADNELRLAGLSGHTFGDWPTAMLTVSNEAADARTVLSTQLQTHPRYLATAFPGTQEIPVLRESLADAVWPIDGSTALAQSLMYAMIRHESAYFPGAISPVGAIGLFQIMPATFENRKDCWAWEDRDTSPSPASYLFNPRRNVQFWSCWIQKELKPRTREGIAQLLMVHNAGIGNVREWRKAWQGRAMEDDLELQIEAVPFRATQNFVRRVLTDTAIAESSGQVGAGGAGDEQTS